MPEGGTHEETLATEDTRRENDRLIEDNDSSLDHIRARNGSHPGHECAWKAVRRFGGGRYSVLWCSHKFLGRQFIQLLNLAVARSPSELGGNPCRRRSRSPHRVVSSQSSASKLVIQPHRAPSSPVGPPRCSSVSSRSAWSQSSRSQPCCSPRST